MDHFLENFFVLLISTIINCTILIVIIWFSDLDKDPSTWMALAGGWSAGVSTIICVLAYRAEQNRRLYESSNSN